MSAPHPVHVQLPMSDADVIYASGFVSVTEGSRSCSRSLCSPGGSSCPHTDPEPAAANADVADAAATVVVPGSEYGLRSRSGHFGPNRDIHRVRCSATSVDDDEGGGGGGDGGQQVSSHPRTWSLNVSGRRINCDAEASLVVSAKWETNIKRTN